MTKMSAHPLEQRLGQGAAGKLPGCRWGKGHAEGGRGRSGEEVFRCGWAAALLAVAWLGLMSAVAANEPSGVGEGVVSEGASSGGRVLVVRSSGAAVIMQTLAEALQTAGNNDQVLVYGQHRIAPMVGTFDVGPSLAPLQIVSRTNLTLRGEAGAEIYGEGPGDFLSIEDSKQVRIQGITFRGNRPLVDQDLPHLFSMVLLRGTNTEVSVSRCRFVDFGNHGVSHLFGPKWSTHVSVKECYFENGGARDVPGLGFDGAAVSGIGSFWEIMNNKVVDCVRGFELENPGDNFVEGVEISGNSFRGVTDLGVMLFAPQGNGYRFSDIQIVGNIFQDFRDSSGSATAIRLGAGRRVMIARNIVRGMSRQGIALASTDGPLSSVTIANNLVSSVGNNGIALGRVVHEVADVSIVDNQSSFCGEAGIRVSGGEDVVISGNLCHENGLYVEAAGIEVADASHVLLRGNVCYDSRAVKTQDFGIWIRKEASSVVLRDNVCLDERAVVAGMLVEASDVDTLGDKTSGTRVTLSGSRTFTFVIQETPFIKSVSVTPDGKVTLTWTATIGALYQVQYRDSLRPGVWLDAGKVLAGIANTMTFTDDVGGAALRYYRVVQTLVNAPPAASDLPGNP